MSQPSFIVAFDSAHKERGKISSSLSKLTTEILNKNGFFCENYAEFPITSKNLRPFDILVFACPDNSRISRQEIDALKRWVREEGGGFIGEYSVAEGLRTTIESQRACRTIRDDF